MIYEFKVRITRADTIEWEKTERKILGENEDYLVISDHRFSSLRKTKSDYEMMLDEVYVSDWTKYNWGEKFSISLYSRNPSVKIAENRVNRAFQKYCQEKCSPYMFGHSLKIRMNKGNLTPTPREG